MVLLEPTYHTTTSPGYFDTTAAQNDNLKTTFRKIIEALKEETHETLKESQKKINKQWWEMNKPLKKIKKSRREA